MTDEHEQDKEQADAEGKHDELIVPDPPEQANEESTASDAKSTEPPTIESLTAELEAARQAAVDADDRALRAVAEAENVRKRSNRAIENAHKYALETFAAGLLPVIDSFEKAVETARTLDPDDDTAKAMVEGIELSLKLFTDVLDKSAIKAIDPVGEPFDPELHQAMSLIESPDAEPGSVIQVVQKGYTLNDRLVRAAMVLVAKEAPADSG